MKKGTGGAFQYLGVDFYKQFLSYKLEGKKTNNFFRRKTVSYVNHKNDENTSYLHPSSTQKLRHRRPKKKNQKKKDIDLTIPSTFSFDSTVHEPVRKRGSYYSTSSCSMKRVLDMGSPKSETKKKNRKNRINDWSLVLPKYRNRRVGVVCGVYNPNGVLDFEIRGKKKVLNKKRSEEEEWKKVNLMNRKVKKGYLRSTTVCLMRRGMEYDTVMKLKRKEKTELRRGGYKTRRFRKFKKKKRRKKKKVNVVGQVFKLKMTKKKKGKEGKNNNGLHSNRVRRRHSFIVDNEKFRKEKKI